MKDTVQCLICNRKFKRITDTHLAHHKMTVKDYKVKFPEAEIVSEKTLNAGKMTCENMVNKYGPELGLIRWNSYREKQAKSNTFEYKRDKHGWSEDQFQEYNKNRSVTKENLIKRHGKEEGLRKWYAYVERQRYAGCKLEYFIEKYGDEIGFEKYLKINKSKSNSRQKLIAKHGIEKYTEDLAIRLNKANTYSKISQDLFKELDLLQSPDAFYASKNKEYFIYEPIDKIIRFYDYVDVKRKKCIEFNGDRWHANPEIYNEDAKPMSHVNLSAKEIWEKDSLKNKLITDRGFEIMIVWERDFKLNPEEVIQQCLEFLYTEDELRDIRY